MEPNDLFKKSEGTGDSQSTDHTHIVTPSADHTHSMKPAGDDQVGQEEDFETKSARLSAAVETARDGMDLGDIPARDDHPYHLAVNEHRLHELKRKK